MTRSENMSRIRSRDTGPEVDLRRELHRRGLRYRLHSPTLPGRPDLHFVHAMLVVFVNGCFWHKHPGCKYAVAPKTNSHYWGPKLQRNVERDARNVKELRRRRYRITIVWECEIRTNLAKIAARIERKVRAQ